MQTNAVAEAAGVRCSAWVVDRWGSAWAAAECRRIRDARRRGVDPGPPRWTTEDPDSTPAAPDPVLTAGGDERTVDTDPLGVVPERPRCDLLLDVPDPF